MVKPSYPKALYWKGNENTHTHNTVRTKATRVKTKKEKVQNTFKSMCM